MQPFEKLGAFYLGKEYDIETGELTDDLVMYDARDLTTHAVVVGMTGSGKTGLCIDILEEAAIDSVPALLIDPKGDITNLLLTFPDLRPEDFEPWVNVDDARRKGLSVDEYARTIAQTWREGLARWGQGPERIRMLKESAEFRIYTPGSDAGLQVSILSSLQAPALDWDEDEEALREQIQGTVSALLGLAGVDADPLKSREHILLSTIFEYFWRRGEDLDMARLIQAIQDPPVRKLGVFDVDTFFPEKDRFELAMSLNNIIAAPGFASWLEGEPLDIAAMLHAPDGKPRHSIFYIAHLSEEERMFFVTLLLEQVIAWMHQQSGTTSLRALLYMDAVFGYFPPIANPPSKKPLLVLIKQARAYGLGVILATQNPADIDYKGLTNAGTWFIGKLQADRDKQRLLDGLQTVTGAAGRGLNRRQMEKIITALDSRVFVLHNVHEDEPIIFKTRWAMSYLRGPLARRQVRVLMDPLKARSEPGEVRRAAAFAPTAAAAPMPAAEPSETLPEGYSTTPPVLPPSLSQAYLPIQTSPNRALIQLEKTLGRQLRAEDTRLVYEPGLIALGRVRFVDRRRGVDAMRRIGLVVEPDALSAVIRWDEAQEVSLEPDDLLDEPDADEAWFAQPPESLNTPRDLKAYAKDFSNHLYHEQRLPLLYHPTLKLYSRPDESEREFKVRVQMAARERRDAEVEKLRKKYRRTLDRLEKRLEREREELAEDKAEFKARKVEEMVSGAETVLGLFGIFGRRRSVSAALTKRRMTARAKADIEESEAEIARLEEELEEMQQEIEDGVAEITEKWEEALEEIDVYEVKPRRVDVQVDVIALAWLPYWEISYRSAGDRLAVGRISAWT
ncbi:MAG: ATP-binding protein [Chloroflexi bacterium]|nr:ATP-binding protein [Chloroflexota bacterium]